MLTVSGKTSCHSHCWLEDVIQLILPGLTGGNSGYAGNMRGYRQNAMKKHANPLAPKEIFF